MATPKPEALAAAAAAAYTSTSVFTSAATSSSTTSTTTTSSSASAAATSISTAARRFLERRQLLSPVHPERLAAVGDAPPPDDPYQAAIPLDDGFRPPTCSCVAPRVLPQPPPRSERLAPRGGRGRELVRLDDALEAALAVEAYTFSCQHGGPWGAYCRLEGIANDGTLQLASPSDEEPAVERLAARLLCSLWARGVGELLAPDLDRIHGFSVWSVVGGEGAATEYHVDYAEMYRRRTGLLRPPLHALTLQLSPLGPADFEGGTFGAHLSGLQHYAAHGYKCRLAPPPADEASKLPTPDWGRDGGWRYAPYAFNQATLSAGDLPHAASYVHRWPAHTPRVVVGVNTFGPLEGVVEEETPQHSARFRRALRLSTLEGLLSKMPRKELERLVKAKLDTKRQQRAAAAAADDAAGAAEAGGGAQRQERRTLPL